MKAERITELRGLARQWPWWARRPTNELLDEVGACHSMLRIANAEIKRLQDISYVSGKGVSAERG